MNVIMEIRGKILTFCAPPFKVTQGHWNRHESIGCPRLPISVPCSKVPMDLSRMVSKIKSKIADFFIPVYMTAPLTVTGFPLNFRNMSLSEIGKV